MATHPTHAAGAARASRAGILQESEKAFQAAIVQFAELRGWLWYHSQDSRRDPAGFPDLVLVRAPRLIMAELKTPQGTLRDEQALWLAALGSCPGVETYLWRPADWLDIERLLA